METIKVMLDEGAFMPDRAHGRDAGMDIRSPKFAVVPAHGSVVIDSGVHVDIPEGYAGELISKSGLNVKYGILSNGLIDSGYTGSITVKLYNHSPNHYNVYVGDKISQLVIYKVETPVPVQVDEFGDSERGDNGFGSTGR